MKTKTLLLAILFFAIFFNGKAQVNIELTNVISDVNKKAVVTADNFLLIAGDSINLSGGIIKVMNKNTGSLIRSIWLDEGNGTFHTMQLNTANFIPNATIFSSYKYDNINDVSRYKIRIDDISTGSNILLEDISGAQFHSSHTDGQFFYAGLSAGIDYDPLGSGLQPYSIVGNYSIAKINQAGNIIWHKPLPSGEGYSKKIFFDGNDILVHLSLGKMVKIDALTGNVIEIIVDINGSFIYHYDSNYGKTYQSSIDVREIKTFIGTVETSDTDIEPNNLWSQYPQQINCFGNKIVLAQKGFEGMGKISILNRSLVSSEDNLHETMLTGEYMPTSLRDNLVDWDILEVNEDNIRVFISYTGNPGTIFGTVLPNAGSGIKSFTYRYNFLINPAKSVIINDISNTNSEVYSVHPNSVLVSGNFISEPIAIGYVVFETDADVPVIGSNISSLGLYDAGTDMSIITSVSGDVRIGTDGVRFVDIFTLDTSVSTTPIKISYVNYRIKFTSRDALSVNNYAIAGLSLYPVPAKDILTVRSNQPIDKIEVFDILGRQIKVFSNDNEIDLSNINTGVYLLKMTQGVNTQIKKIIKRQ